MSPGGDEMPQLADSNLLRMVSPVLKDVIGGVGVSMPFRDARGEKNCFIEKRDGGLVMRSRDDREWQRRGSERVKN